MVCEKCGKLNTPGARFCAGCGKPLAGPTVIVANEGGLVSPMELAEWSCCLGVASFIFCCSFVTGIPALITGILALPKLKDDPSPKGQILAWTGIVLGGLSFLWTPVAIIIFGVLTDLW